MSDHTTRGEKRKSVTFNLDKPKDLIRYEFAKRINLSKFIKHHIDNELDKSTSQHTTR